jgi:hypothetical protein
MRDIETIDRELQLLARAWRVALELCTYPPSIAHIDELLDERSATMVVTATVAREGKVVTATVAREGNTCSRSG